MKILSADRVKEIHSMMIAETGGTDGLRDEGLLESAVNAPFQTFDDQPLYRTIEAKAARLGFSLVNNHAFVDGNKRTGMMSMLVFLEMNGLGREYADEDIIRVGLALADGSMDYSALLEWILNG